MVTLVFDESMQPNAGQTKMPADDATHRRLVDLAARIDDDAERAGKIEKLGRSNYYAENGALHGGLTGQAECFARAVDDQAAVIGRHRAARDAATAAKSFLARGRIDLRMGLNRFLTILAVFGLALLFAPLSEQKTMAEVLIASGRFSFIDHSPESWFWAAVYCLAPMMFALSKRLEHAQLPNDATRAAYRRKLARRSMAWTLAWIAIFAVVMGPGLMAAGATAIDPFNPLPAWVGSALAVSDGVLRVLDGLGWVLSGLLVLCQIIAMSGLVAWILVADGHEQGLARHENVRVGEVHAHHVAELARLEDEYRVTLDGLRRIEGLQQALENECQVYVAQLASDVEMQRDLARSAVTAQREKYLSQSNVVDLFGRRA